MKQRKIVEETQHEIIYMFVVTWHNAVHRKFIETQAWILIILHMYSAYSLINV